MRLSFTVLEKALEASFYSLNWLHVKKTHTIGETLLKPACQEIVRFMLGPKKVKEVSKVALSADTIYYTIYSKKQIDHMSQWYT